MVQNLMLMHQNFVPLLPDKVLLSSRDVPLLSHEVSLLPGEVGKQLDDVQ